MTSDRRRDQRGQAAPLIVAAVCLAGLLGAGVVQVGVAASNRAGAQAAADAVALAGAAAGEGAARQAAWANEADLVEFHVEGDHVVVEVERRGVDATATARSLANFAIP